MMVAEQCLGLSVTTSDLFIKDFPFSGCQRGATRCSLISAFFI